MFWLCTTLTSYTSLNESYVHGKWRLTAHIHALCVSPDRSQLLVSRPIPALHSHGTFPSSSIIFFPKPMHTRNPRVYMLLRRPPNPFIPWNPPLPHHPLDRHQHRIAIWMHEIRKGVPIQASFGGGRDDAVPGRFQPPSRPELKHVSDID